MQILRDGVYEDIGSKNYAMATEYDSFGRVVKETYPSGYYTENIYDSNGHLTRITDSANRPIWMAVYENARRQPTLEALGGMIGLYHEYNDKGQLISSRSPFTHWLYSYNDKGNLERRTDGSTGQREEFGYDALNRLLQWDIYRGNTLQTSNNMSYNSAGNIVNKRDLGIHLTMSYGANGKPHALTSITGVPSVFPQADLHVTYTDFKKVKILSEGNKFYEITYGGDEQRRKSEYYEDNVLRETRYYFGNYEEKTDHITGITEKIHYLSGAIYIERSNGRNNFYHALTDNIGSLIALVHEITGIVAERYAYDPWGVRRNPTNWTQNDNRSTWIVNRGYTGHEMLDKFGVINMNGRVYDPLTAQFFSPDPFVQAPENWVNYNRYLYVFGNPFKYTDPTGEIGRWVDGNNFDTRPMNIRGLETGSAWNIYPGGYSPYSMYSGSSNYAGFHSAGSSFNNPSLASYSHSTALEGVNMMGTNNRSAMDLAMEAWNSGAGH